MPGHQASRTLRRAATVLPLAASVVVGLFGCAEANRILVSGNVDDDLVVVQAPQIEVPEPDLNAGFADAKAGTPGLATSGGQTAAASRPLSAASPTGSWSRISTVEVREGDRVQAGQVLVRFDSEALRANVSVARADAKVAASQVPVLDSAIDKTYDKEHSVKSALKKINNAIRQLKSTRAKLSGQLSQARRELPQLEAKRVQLQGQRQQLQDKLRQVNLQLAELQKALSQLPPQPPTTTTTPSAIPASPNRKKLLATLTKLQQGRTQLQSGLKQLTPAEAQLTTALGQLRTGIPKLENAIAKIDAGLAKARTQRAKLHKARTKIIDARAELRKTRKLAVVAADAATIGVHVAENQKLLATVTASASGAVVHAPTVGDVLASGATIATIRKDDATSLTTWLSASQLAQVCLGSQASVYADWMTGDPLGAMITLIGDQADYPPTPFATEEVHLTRAVPVRLSLTRSSGQPRSLPPGAPVDIEILPASNDHSCSTGTTSR
jgi:multidrug efflux pump subunit AcrA (membrane-fusion protein)